MDDVTFDSLTRLTATRGRRGAIRQIAGLTLGALAGLAALGPDDTVARRRKRRRKKRKSRGGAQDPAACQQTLCDGACVDLSSDQANCGECGNACLNGFTCCDGVCRALDIDNSNCGACGNECFISGSRFCICGECVFCPLGGVSPEGSCTCECPEGQVECDGVCRDAC